jgi:hypothetical protein
VKRVRRDPVRRQVPESFVAYPEEPWQVWARELLKAYDSKDVAAATDVVSEIRSYRLSFGDLSKIDRRSEDRNRAFMGMAMASAALASPVLQYLTERFEEGVVRDPLLGLFLPHSEVVTNSAHEPRRLRPLLRQEILGQTNGWAAAAPVFERIYDLQGKTVFDTHAAIPNHPILQVCDEEAREVAISSRLLERGDRLLLIPLGKIGRSLVRQTSTVGRQIPVLTPRLRVLHNLDTSPETMRKEVEHSPYVRALMRLNSRDFEALERLFIRCNFPCAGLDEEAFRSSATHRDTLSRYNNDFHAARLRHGFDIPWDEDRFGYYGPESSHERGTNAREPVLWQNSWTRLHTFPCPK